MECREPHARSPNRESPRPKVDSCACTSFVVFLNAAVTRLAKRRQFFHIAQAPPFFFEPFIFADRQLRAFEFGNLKLQRVDQLKLLSFVMTQRIEFTPHRIPFLVSLRDITAQRTIAREGVEYFEMCFGIEKRLLIALPVNVDEVRSEITQQRLRCELIVDEDLVTSGSGESRRMISSLVAPSPAFSRNFQDQGSMLRRTALRSTHAPHPI